MTAPAWQLLAAERDLQEAIRVAALRNGWLYMHVYDSRRSPAGFPDAIMVKDGRVLVFEIKKQTGRVSPKQREWIERFALVPDCTAAIVRPEPKDGERSYDWALEELAR